MKRRKIKIGPDGKADVLILTDPIPRHLSVVSWGANDRPAASWKSAEGPAPTEEQLIALLRSPPGDTVTMLSGMTLERIQAFVAETMSAWVATMDSTLAAAITGAERSARVRALTAQAGARIAVFARATEGPHLSAAVRSHKSTGLEMPKAPTAATLDGELERRAFSEAVQMAAASASEQAIAAMASPAPYRTSSEAILSLFGSISTFFSQWAGSIQDGTVGVTQNAGRRHSRADETKLREAASIILGLLPEPAPEPAPEGGEDEGQPGPGQDNVPTSTEKSAMFSLNDLKRVAGEDPVAFVAALKSAFAEATAKDPSVTKNFAWGETGVDELDPDRVIQAIRGAQSGEAILSLIAGAIGGIDLNKTAAGNSPNVASSMKAAFSKVVSAEIASNPTGELAVAVKGLLEPVIVEAITESIKLAFNGTERNPAGFADFSDVGGTSDDDSKYLEPMIP